MHKGIFKIRKSCLIFSSLKKNQLKEKEETEPGAFVQQVRQKLRLEEEFLPTSHWMQPCPGKLIFLG